MINSQSGLIDCRSDCAQSSGNYCNSFLTTKKMETRKLRTYISKKYFRCKSSIDIRQTNWEFLKECMLIIALSSLASQLSDTTLKSVHTSSLLLYFPIQWPRMICQRWSIRVINFNCQWHHFFIQLSAATVELMIRCVCVCVWSIDWPTTGQGLLIFFFFLLIEVNQISTITKRLNG